MILKNLFRRRARSLLTLIGVAIGVAAMVTLRALAAGMASGYQSMASGSQADFVLTQRDAYDLTLSAVDEQIGNELRGMPEVREVAGTLMGNVSAAEGAKYFFIFGHDPTGFVIDRYRLLEGENLGVTGIRGHPLLLGKVAADALELEVGDTIRLTGTVFRVVGIFETGDAFEDGGAIISLADAQILLQKQRLVSGFYVKLKDTSLADRFENKIERRYPDLQLATAAEFGDRQQIVDYLEGFGVGIGVLAVLVGGVFMTNTVLMSVLECTREIGVLRAIGWRRRRVLGMILGEAMLLALIGAGVGALLGIAVVYSIRDVPLFGFMQGEFSTALFLETFALALSLGLFGGFYPAWRATRLTPLEALRYSDGSEFSRKGGIGALLGGMVFKNLMRRKMRTSLTMVAIGIGIGAVVAMGGVMESFQAQLSSMLGGDAHLVAIEADVSDFGYSAIDERVGARIAAHPQIAHISGVVFAILTNFGDAPFFIVFGYHPQEAGISHFKIVEGEPLTANRQVLLGRTAAESLNRQVGDTIRMGSSAFRVVGIYETGTGWEDGGAVVTMRDAQVMGGRPRQVSMYAIELREPQEINEVKDWLDREVPEVDVSITSEFAEGLPDMESARAMIGSLAVLMALVGSVGMTNTVLMSVLERTREIGVLRALGWSRRRILGMILRESLVLSLLGAAAGLAIAYLLMLGLGQIPGMGGLLTPYFSPTIVLQALVVALILGGLGGLYPAWRATTLQPVEALRYE